MVALLANLAQALGGRHPPSGLEEDFDLWLLRLSEHPIHCNLNAIDCDSEHNENGEIEEGFMSGSGMYNCIVFVTLLV